MTIRILTGDCRDVMRAMEADSVDCIVTSPPYWGLRDYGTPGQLGLEATLGEHIATMVGVFEEARRVLKPTGTVFLNYGDCYFGGSAARRDAQTNGTSCTAQPDYPDSGSSCPDLCDGCAVALLHRTTDNIQPPPGLNGNGGTISQHTDALEIRRLEQDALLPGVQASTTQLSLPQHPGVCSHCANCGACLSVLRSSSRDARLCARRAEYSCDSVGNGSAFRNRDKGALGSAYDSLATASLKPKDLCMVPNRLAIALQDSGWWVRSEIIWAKPNPMPESVRDRPTSAHEKIWLLTKQERYFYDAEAIAEEALQPLGEPKKSGAKSWDALRNGGTHTSNGLSTSVLGSNQGAAIRNRRNVWTVPSQPFSEAHFATFPPALIEPCVLAGCPQKCCAKCGKPWVRRVERSKVGGWGDPERSNDPRVHTGGPHTQMPGYLPPLSAGFRPSCHCKADTTPGVVLDPFGGSGTTGMVADRLGRNAILIELNSTYAAMAQSRIINDLPLFAEVLA